MATSKSKASDRFGDAQIEISEMLSYRISVVANAMSRGAAVQYKKQFGLALGEWRVIALLGASHPRSLNELARAANLDAGQTSRFVTNLTKRGLVLRNEELGAGLRVWLSLSRAGRSLYLQLMGVARQRHEIFLSVLTAEERRALDRALVKLGAIAKAVGKGEIALSDGSKTPKRAAKATRP